VGKWGVEDRKMRMATNSKVLGNIPLLVTICLLGIPARAKYGGGTGEPNDPYVIYTAEQMNTIGAKPNDWNKHFKLMADIDLGQFDGKEGRERFNVIGTDEDDPFAGVFDGNGHTISNFSYTSTGRNKIGLFGYVRGEDVEIKDLGLIDPTIDAGTADYVGSLIGSRYPDSGTIANCYVEGGSVSGGSGVGGLVGYSGAGIWAFLTPRLTANCYSSASVSGTARIGGLVGYSSYGAIITHSR
jgi:hypothetical protein